MKIFIIIIISWFFFMGCEPSISKGKIVSKEYIAEHYDYRIKGASTHYPEKFVVRITDGEVIAEIEVCKEDFELCEIDDVIEVNRVKIIKKTLRR